MLITSHSHLITEIMEMLEIVIKVVCEHLSSCLKKKLVGNAR